MDRLAKALAFIENTLDRDIELADIAGAAALSPYHFARLFRTFSGLSAMEYVRRRRLSQSAGRLRSSQDRIIEISIDASFESQEAFSRAFKNFTGLTPGHYRKFGAPGGLHLQFPITALELKLLKGIVAMEPTIKQLPEFHVAGMETDVTMETRTKIPRLWDEFAPHVGKMPNRSGENTFGVCILDDAANDESFKYLAGVAVTDLSQVPPSMTGRTLSAQNYAVFTFEADNGPFPETLHKFVHYIWSVWLPKSEYETTGAPDFELYDERFNPIANSGEFDIYVPVKSASS